MPRQTTPLQSSFIENASYDADTQQLDITFRNGTMYTYVGVPPDVHNDLITDASPGQFYHAHIKGQYG